MGDGEDSKRGARQREAKRGYAVPQSVRDQAEDNGPGDGGPLDQRGYQPRARPGEPTLELEVVGEPGEHHEGSVERGEVEEVDGQEPRGKRRSDRLPGHRPRGLDRFLGHPCGRPLPRPLRDEESEQHGGAGGGDRENEERQPPTPAKMESDEAAQDEPNGGAHGHTTEDHGRPYSAPGGRYGRRGEGELGGVVCSLPETSEAPEDEQGNIARGQTPESRGRG